MKQSESYAIPAQKENADSDLNFVGSVMPFEELRRLRRLASRHLGRIVATARTTIDRDTSRAPLRALGKYAMTYLLEGEGRYTDSNGLNLPLTAGDLILVFPEVAHRYGPGPKQHWRETWVVFEGPAFDMWRQAGVLDPAKPVRHLEPVDHWQRRIESIVGLPQGPSSAPLLEFCRLQQVLAEALISSAIASFTLDDFAWSIRACALLESEEHYGTPLPEAARQLNMSYSSFRMKFTRIMGLSPARYRSQRIMEQACQLMQQTGLTNQQIAPRLGFADEFHFSHRFKQMTGRSPKAFRQSLFRSAPSSPAAETKRVGKPGKPASR